MNNTEKTEEEKEIEREEFEKMIDDSLQNQEYQLEYDDIEDMEIDYPEDEN